MSIEGEVRPLRPGIEVGISGGPRGTLGLLLENAAKERFALSCSHVLALCGEAHPDTLVKQPANPFVDPTGIAVGKLTTTFTVLDFGWGINTEDFAVARITPAIACVPSFANAEHAPRTAFAGGPDDMRDCPTQLNGIITRGARGVVSSSQKDRYRIAYPGFGVAEFEGAVQYETACSEGDSGAAVMLADTNVVLGIHISGKSDDGIGYLLPIASFLTKHGFIIFVG